MFESVPDSSWCSLSVTHLILPRKDEISRWILFLATVSALASGLAAQTNQLIKRRAARVKPAEVHFEDVASQAGLIAVNVYGGDTHSVHY